MFQEVSSVEGGIVESEVSSPDGAVLNGGTSLAARRTWMVVALCAGVIVGAAVSSMVLLPAHDDHSVSSDESIIQAGSPQSDPAWIGAGQQIGLQIWRIVRLKVVAVPKADYGTFFAGDSYIVLNTYKKNADSALLYNIHYLIGKLSTKDEYGTAARKARELSQFLGGQAMVHKETQGKERSLFKSYFDDLKYMPGGADAGFKPQKSSRSQKEKARQIKKTCQQIASGPASQKASNQALLKLCAMRGF